MDNYIHDMPGILRIKNEVFKDNITLLDKVRDSFEGAAGIEYVTTNPLSGTFIIDYDAGVIRPNQLLKVLREDVIL